MECPCCKSLAVVSVECQLSNYYTCCAANCPCISHKQPDPAKGDAVEEKIKQLDRWFHEDMKSSYHHELVNILVDLVRKYK
jgi:hypothetical protein